MAEQITALSLPDAAMIRSKMAAITAFQQIVHQTLKPGVDYGIIPGTDKPTLLKPGAEKIDKLLDLADLYDIVDRQEDWNKPFFRYLIKCRLVAIGTDQVISECMGECNSMESKYRYRWVYEKDIPKGMDKSKLVSKQFTRKDGKGKFWKYRTDNEDIYSQVNTLIKMAQKRGMVGASLSAGRLSELFTQDLEDMAPENYIDSTMKVIEEEPPAEAPPAPAKEKTTQPSPPQEKAAPRPEATQTPSIIDMTWLKESLATLESKKLKAWTAANVLKLINSLSGHESASIEEGVGKLSCDKSEIFCKKVQETLDMA